VNANRDLILVDQRGTFLSEPALTCPEIDRANKDILGLRYDSPAARQALVGAAQICHDEFVAQGIDLSAYNTVENAADFKDLRQVLGYSRWDVYGVSYGTALALRLTAIDPSGIDHLVLDSIVPPEQITLAPFWENARQGFDALFAACAAQAACNSSFPALGQQVTDLVRHLEQTPNVVSIQDPVSQQTVSINTDGGALANWLLSESLHSKDYPAIPSWISDLANGDGRAVAASRLAGVVPEGYAGYGLTFGVICSEWYPYASRSEIGAAGQQAFPDYPKSVTREPAQFTNFGSVCRVWNVPRGSASLRQPVTTDRPTLVLAGDFDAITPPQWGRQVVEALTHVTAITIPGVGHDVLQASACARSVMAGFLADANFADLACVHAAVPPFAPPPAP
jgi:pimeloyl-ACP methyl ester carboxylesterase